MLCVFSVDRRSCLRITTGFTLIELLVVITIISLLISILLPSLQANRESTNQAATADNLQQIGLAVHNFQQTSGVLPGAIAANDRFWQGVSSTRDLAFSATGDTLIGAGYEIDYLPAAGAFVLSAEPVAPGLTGSNALLLTAVAGTPPTEDDIATLPLEDANRLRAAALDKVRDCALESVAALLLDEGDEETARLAKGGVDDENNQAIAFLALDLDGDGQVTLAEICESEEAPLPPDLTACICETMRIGAGGERTGDIGVGFDDLEDDASGLFSFEDVCLYAAARVDKSGVAIALCQKLMAASSAEADGDLEMRDDILASFQSHVAAQRGKSIRPEDAVHLHILAEVLKAE